MEKPMSNSVKVSSFITYGSCKPKHHRHKTCHVETFFFFIHNPADVYVCTCSCIPTLILLSFI